MNAEEVALARQLIAIAVDKESLARPSPAAYTLLGSKLLQWPQDKLFPVTYSLSMCAVFLPTDVYVHTAYIRMHTGLQAFNPYTCTMALGALT